MISLLCAILLRPSMYAEEGQEVRFRDLAPGVHLLLYDPHPGMEPEGFGVHLFVGANVNPATLHSLNDLAGYVNITSPRAALDYVRLLTSRSTWDIDWGSRNCEAEVTPLSVSRRAANYGINPGSFPKHAPGWLGVLPDALFKRIRVVPAQVKANGSGFIVTRTLLVDDRSSQRFDYCEEDVSRNGAYRRRVLKSSPAPKSDNWFWYFPRTE